MGIPNKIGKYVLMPLYDMVTGRDITSLIKDHKRNERKTRSQIASLQNNKLKALITHAYLTVPYYRRSMEERGIKPDDIKTTEDIQKIPILTKEDIIKKRDQLVSRRFDKSDLIEVPTGGSTGQPLKLWFEPEKLDILKATRVRFESWMGLDINDRHALIWGGPNEIRINTTLKGKAKNFMMNRIFLDSFEMTETKMRQYAKKINRFRPKVITGYANSVYLFAKFVEKEGITIHSPDAILTTAERLYPFQRRKIEKVFKTKVYNSYGCREVGDIAQECEHGNMHINADNLLVEFIRKGKRSLPGETGEIIITDLNSKAMPLIRYRIGDLGKPSSKKCPCGRPFPIMEVSKGRVSDLFLSTDGKIVHGEYFTHLFYDIKGVEQFQVIQESKELIIVRMKCPERPQNKTLERIRKAIKHKIGQTDVKFEFPKNMKGEASGKHLFTKSKIRIDFYKDK